MASYFTPTSIDPAMFLPSGPMFLPSQVWSLKSKVFVLLTTKSPSPLIPPPVVVSTLCYLSVYTAALVGLYLILLSPYPRTTTSKRLLGAPMWATLFFLPLFFRCPDLTLHALSIGASSFHAMRFFDILFVQPWSGAGKRYCNTHSPTMDHVAATKKDLDPHLIQTSTAIKLQEPQTLSWDYARFRAEVWAPVRRLSLSRGSRNSQRRVLHWTELVPRLIAFYLIVDMDVFVLSKFAVEDLQSLSWIQEKVFITAMSTCILGWIFFNFNAIAISWSMLGGQGIDPEEWTMVDHYFAFFAINPAEFWSNWHTMLRFIWVDLGFKPVQKLCRLYLGPDRIHPRHAKILASSLPVLGVFFLSGVCHAYLVYGIWREPIWSQMAYFLIQGVAVIATKAFESSTAGKSLHRQFLSSSWLLQRLYLVLGHTCMLVFLFATAPLFLEPMAKQGFWHDIKGLSVFYRLFGN